jgi:prepilin-type processing-associated H-X9-DG protein
VQESGFTTTFTPNTFVPYTYSDGNTYDIDFNSNQESASAIGFTYAAVTARSYHIGGVNVVLMDGSVGFVNNSILRSTWQALGTRAGGEVVEGY